MSQRDPEPNPNGDSDWLAVRYLLDELSSADAESFEQRLAEDQSARESLARATWLIATVAQTMPPARGTVPARRRSRLVRVGAALATIAAVALVGLFVVQNRRDVGLNLAGSQAVEDDDDPARLVVLWSESRESLSGAVEIPTVDDALLAASFGDGGADSSDDLLPPDWMLAAVELEGSPGAGIDVPLDGDLEPIERN